MVFLVAIIVISFLITFDRYKICMQILPPYVKELLHQFNQHWNIAPSFLQQAKQMSLIASA